MAESGEAAAAKSLAFREVGNEPRESAAATGGTGEGLGAAPGARGEAHEAPKTPKATHESRRPQPLRAATFAAVSSARPATLAAVNAVRPETFAAVIVVRPETFALVRSASIIPNNLISQFA